MTSLCKTLDKGITGVKREKVLSQRLSLMRHLSENWRENETGSAQEEKNSQATDRIRSKR